MFIFEHIFVAVSLAAIINSPLAICSAMYFDQMWSSEICATNYQAGASVTESYRDAQRIEMDTNITSNAGFSTCSGTLGTSSLLVASLNSSVIGNATVGWQSASPLVMGAGRHRLISRSVNELSGIFTVSNLIQLYPNSTLGETEFDWVPCV